MPFFENKRILVVAPHPDDETLGCGGLIAAAKHGNATVAVLALCVGDAVQYGSSSQSTKRKAEFFSATSMLGVDHSEILFADEWHLRLDTLPQRDLIDRLEKSINTFRPDFLIVPGPSYNQDHNAAFSACMSAARPYSSDLKHTPTLVLAYSHWDEYSWSANIFEVPRKAFVVDTSDFLKTKLSALTCYESQMKSSENHWRTLQNVEMIDRAVGKKNGLTAAEEFFCLRHVVAGD
jgi:LmbE family N-acetylglucosaminyl deacetylase